MIMIDYKDELDKVWYMWSMQLAHTNSSVSPFLYYWFNPHIQNGVKALLCRKKSTNSFRRDKSRDFDTTNGTARANKSLIKGDSH